MKKKLAIVTCSIIGLLVLVLIGISLVLTPERLTRWVRQYGSEYLVDGRVEVQRVDLSIWSTFPNAVLTVDSLRVENLAVPKEYQTVISCERIEGRLNLPALLAGRISVGHALLDRPQATVWFGSDSTESSLSFLPSSEPEQPDNQPLSLPDIRLSRFIISGDACFRYVSKPDSLDAAVVIRQTDLHGRDAMPEYQLSVDGGINLPKALLAVDSLKVALDGAIGWNSSNPLAVELQDFTVAVDSIRTQTSLKADFSDGIRLNELKFRLMPLPLKHLASLLADLPEVETPALLTASAELLEPYVYDPDTLLLPALKAQVLLGDAPVKIPSYYLNLENLGLDLQANISPAGPDSSTVELRRLNVKFPASDFNLSGTATNLAADPKIDACFRGKVNFSRLDRRLWAKLGMRLKGKLDADVDLNSNLSSLTLNGFHKARLRGDAKLNDFVAYLPADTIVAGVGSARLRFGNASGFHGIDSLLMAGLSADTLWAYMPGVKANMSEMKLSFGVKNLDTLGDTTTVTPMGGRLSLKRLTYVGADSTRARLRDINGIVSLSRYQGGKRVPKLGMKLDVKTLAYATGPTFAILRDMEIAARAHMEQRKKRTTTTADSLRRARMIADTEEFETLDLGVDRSSVRLLKRWNLRGGMKARRGGVRTPLFPLRMRLREVDLTFSPDSINLNSLNLKAGQSDLAINGSITNIQKALGRRRKTNPLKMELNLRADTINVNQLTQAAFQGAAYAATMDSTAVATLDLDADIDQAGDTASAEMMAIVIPMNVDATVNLAAKEVIYSTLALNDFRGQILVANGAANLRDLHAASSIGSVDLNMLYSAPTLKDVNFGLALDLNRFNIGRVTEILPQLDSIMPILNTLGGIVDVGISATSPVDSMLNLRIPQLKALVAISGDSLRVLDQQTFKTMSKWLFFHDKNKNLIDHMDVKLAVDNNQLALYPFMFDFDRYRIGVMGHNDLDLNLDYHVSILKSPMPFKFGINIKGSADKMKIRLGRARFKENMAAETTALADTVRINLAREIKSVFARGTQAARLGPLELRKPQQLQEIDEAADTLNAEQLTRLQQ